MEDHYRTMRTLDPGAPFEPKQISKAVANTRTQTLAKLKAVRDAIAYDLDNCRSIKERAPLYNRLLDTLDRIEILSKPASQQGDLVDEIAARRTARRSRTAKDSARPPRAQ